MEAPTRPKTKPRSQRRQKHSCRDKTERATRQAHENSSGAQQQRRPIRTRTKSTRPLGTASSSRGPPSPAVNTHRPRIQKAGHPSSSAPRRGPPSRSPTLEPTTRTGATTSPCPTDKRGQRGKTWPHAPRRWRINTTWLPPHVPARRSPGRGGAVSCEPRRRSRGRHRPTAMTPGADAVIIAVAEASRSEQARRRSSSRRAAEAPSVPSSYVVWEKER